jgi:hypothetical protein
LSSELGKHGNRATPEAIGALKGHGSDYWCHVETTSIPSDATSRGVVGVESVRPGEIGVPVIPSA